jgi:hypothetical protein
VYNHAPFGWDADGDYLVANASEQATLKRLLALRKRGLGYLKVATILNEEGHKTKRGGPWQAMSVRNITSALWKRQPAAWVVTGGKISRPPHRSWREHRHRMAVSRRRACRCLARSFCRRCQRGCQRARRAAGADRRREGVCSRGRLWPRLCQWRRRNLRIRGWQ